VSLASAKPAPWETLDNCTLAENQYNDGDSFRVRQGDREFIFRLYFVDTPEMDDAFKERVQEQADYFGVDSKTVVEVGQQAATYVRQQLSQPFTVVTRWQQAQGRSKLPRFYAFVEVNGQDLGSLLVSQGLARVFGVRATTPKGMVAETARAALLALEDSARHERLGAWITSRQLNVAEARAEAMKADTPVIMTPHTVSIYSLDLPRRRLGEILRDTHVHLLEEYSDGYVRIAHEVNGADQEVMCLRWELGLPELPAAPAALRVEQPETVPAVN
jgi:endonuclease YncB( thermonuclease family)